MKNIIVNAAIAVVLGILAYFSYDSSKHDKLFVPLAAGCVVFAGITIKEAI